MQNNGQSAAAVATTHKGPKPTALPSMIRCMRPEHRNQQAMLRSIVLRNFALPAQHVNTAASYWASTHFNRLLKPTAAGGQHSRAPVSLHPVNSTRPQAVKKVARIF
jgi:hypothetical protein